MDPLVLMRCLWMSIATLALYNNIKVAVVVVVIIFIIIVRNKFGVFRVSLRVRWLLLPTEWVYALVGLSGGGGRFSPRDGIRFGRPIWWGGGAFLRVMAARLNTHTRTHTHTSLHLLQISVTLQVAFYDGGKFCFLFHKLTGRQRFKQQNKTKALLKAEDLTNQRSLEAL